MFDEKTLVALDSKIELALTAIQSDPALALQLAQYHHSEIGNLKVFQNIAALGIRESINGPTVAERLARCNTAWVSSPAAQNPEILSMKSSDGFTIAELCSLNSRWCVSPIAQNKAFLICHPNLAFMLAKQSEEWGKLSISQDDDILGLVNNLGEPLASILAKHNGPWALSQAASRPEILMLENAYTNGLVAHCLAEDSQKWLKTANVHNLDILKVRGKHGVTVAQLICSNFSVEDGEWKLSSEAHEWMLSKTASNYNVANICDSKNTPLIFDVISRLALAKTVLEFSLNVDTDVLAISSPSTGLVVAHEFARLCGDAWFNGSDSARTKVTLTLKDASNNSVLNRLIIGNPGQAEKYLRTLITQGASVSFGTDSSRASVRESVARFSAVHKKHYFDALVSNVFDEVEHLNYGADHILIYIALHTTLGNMKDCLTNDAAKNAIISAIERTEHQLLYLLENTPVNIVDVLSQAKNEHDYSREFIDKMLSQLEFSSVNSYLEDEYPKPSQSEQDFLRPVY